jgi:hypothetical protein
VRDFRQRKVGVELLDRDFEHTMNLEQR